MDGASTSEAHFLFSSNRRAIVLEGRPRRTVMLRGECDSCFQNFPVPDKYHGKRVKCPGCGESVVIGRPSVLASPPPLQRGAKHRKAASSGISPQMLIGVGIGAAVLMLFGVIAGVIVSRGGGSVPAPQAVANQETAPARPAETPDTGTASFGAAAVDEAPMPTPVASEASAPLSSAANFEAASTTIPPTTTVASTDGTKTSAATSDAGTAKNASASDSATAPSVPPAERTQKLELVDLIASVEPSVVRLNMVTKDGAGHGSGFIADTNGNAITNYHVVANATKMFAVFADGRQVDVKGYRFVDPDRDMAVVQLDLPAGTVAPLPVAKVLPRKGEAVYGFGSPEGLDFTTSQGIVSAIRDGDELRSGQGLNVKGKWLQTTTPISGGSSGGPLVDSAGNVVGINTMSRTDGQNLNFASACVNLQDALAHATDPVKPFRPEDLKEHELSAKRAKRDEIGTERGNRLLAATDEIFLINLRPKADFDPTGRIWNAVIAQSERVVERAGVKLSFDQPAADAALMLVFMDLKPIRGGGPGAHEMVLQADLICFDPNAPDAEKRCRVWHGEETVGTASILSLASGNVPIRLDAGLRKFFGSFRSARAAAVNGQTREKADAAKSDE
jgi:S1-C subfamily serine protease